MQQETKKGLNLKDSIQIERRIGVQLNFDSDTEFPSDFASTFLRKKHTFENKRVFYLYLVDKILEKAYYKDKTKVVTRNEKIEINLKGTLANINMSDSLHSEANTRIIIHVFSCVRNGLKDIYVEQMIRMFWLHTCLISWKLIAMCKSPSCLELDLTLVAYL